MSPIQNSSMIEDLKPYEHVDDFLDRLYHTQDRGLAYAHFMFTYFRQSATVKMLHHPFMRKFKLFVDYDEVTYRVTGASRLGDIWLTTNFEQDTGYERRVDLDLSRQVNWRAEADFVLDWRQRWPVGRKFYGIFPTNKQVPKKRAQLVKMLDEARVGSTLLALSLVERKCVLDELM